MALNNNEAVELIGKEILWHEQNPDKALSKEYQKGFVNGMIHVRQLLGSAASAVSQDSERVDDIKIFAIEKRTGNREEITNLYWFEERFVNWFDDPAYEFEFVLGGQEVIFDDTENNS